jgi:hypothetical protein
MKEQNISIPEIGQFGRFKKLGHLKLHDEETFSTTV